jgi:hypothetical protein
MYRGNIAPALANATVTTYAVGFPIDNSTACCSRAEKVPLPTAVAKNAAAVLAWTPVPRREIAKMIGNIGASVIQLRSAKTIDVVPEVFMHTAKTITEPK